jgi:hypothetical protein
MKNLFPTLIIVVCFAVGAAATPRPVNGVIDIGAYEF